MKVSVVIPNWNGRHLLEKNLPFILSAAKNPKNSILEIIVVDDFSSDDSVKFLQKHFFGEIRLIKQTSNRGFSYSVNHGVRMAKGELVCLLNTDVSPSENFLVSALSYFKDKKVFAVGLHEKGGSWATASFKNGYIDHAPGKVSHEPKQTFWVSGGSGVFRRSVWMKLKGLDEELLSPFYWEDLDLGYRAHKRGYSLIWDPDAKVLHEHESVINKNSFQIKYLNQIKQRNEILVIWKNVTSKRLFRKHLRSLLMRALRHPGYFRIIYLAWKKRELAFKKRKIETKQSKVSDEAVFAKFN